MKRFQCSARRVLAAGLAGWLAVGMALPVGAAQLPATSDETYYATLDYYGGLMDSSVVKSVRTFGNSSLTDYGSYDQVTNLTDDREAVVSGDKVTFDLSGDVPEKFYFEAKTAQPYTDFPWTLSLSYALNGLPAQAEELAGQKGVVDITLDAVPNLAASEYSRNNLVLTAMSMFNGDDILSLEAPGAQVQLVGNLYCVLYMVMPGEEQHFTIRVGSDDFSYAGMIFLAVPATLDQLSQIADLKEAKEDVEDSYHALQDSMDVILDTLDGMSGNLTATANGLDQLNRARDTISKGKGEVYDSLDTALDAAGPLTDSLQPMADHLATAQEALTETTDLINEVTGNITALKPEVENTRQTILAIQTDTAALKKLLSDVEGYNSKASTLVSDLSDDFDDLTAEIEDLQATLVTLKTALNSVKGISELDSTDILGSISLDVNGTAMSVSDLTTNIANAQKLKAAYDQTITSEVLPLLQQAKPDATVEEAQGQFPFNTFLVTYFTQQGLDEATANTRAAQIQQLLAFTTTQKDQYQELQSTVGTVDSAVTLANEKITEVNTLLKSLTKPTATVVGSLADLCDTLTDDDGLTDDLDDLSDLCSNLLKTLKNHEGEGASLLGHLDEAGDLLTRVTANLDTALDQVQSLTDVMNKYEPETQQALEDAKTLSGSLSTSISALVDAAQSGENLLKSSGTDLDAGTRQALSGLSAALRQSTKGLDQTDVIRSAKETIDALITDQWDSHAGGENNILLMDANAAPVSLTDQRNEGVQSIQYVMRSQEIKVEEESDTQTAAAVQTDNGTIWSRIVDMFRDIWQTLTGWLHKD